MMRRMLSIFMALLLLATPAMAEGVTAEEDWELIPAEGVWTLTAAETEGSAIRDVSALDYEFDLLLHADGTGSLTADGEEAFCTWTQNGSVVTLAEESGDTVSLTLQPDGTLTWVIDDVTLILSRTDDDADASEPSGIAARILGGLESAVIGSGTPDSPADPPEVAEGDAGTPGTVGGIVNAPGAADSGANTPETAGGIVNAPGAADSGANTPETAGGSADTPEPAESVAIVSEFGYSVRLPEGWSALDSDMVAQLVETIGEDLAAANGFDQSMLDQLAAANMSLYFSPDMSANFSVVREPTDYLTMDNFASLEPYYQELYESQGITDFELDGPIEIYGKPCFTATCTTQAGQDQEQYFYLTDGYVFTVTLTDVSWDDAEQILDSFEIL